jgi:hypothetical protein
MNVKSIWEESKEELWEDRQVERTGYQTIHNVNMMGRRCRRKKCKNNNKL